MMQILRARYTQPRTRSISYLGFVSRLQHAVVARRRRDNRGKLAAIAIRHADAKKRGSAIGVCTFSVAHAMQPRRDWRDATRSASARQDVLGRIAAQPVDLLRFAGTSLTAHGHSHLIVL